MEISRKEHGSEFCGIFRREIGMSDPRIFWRRISGSEGMLKKTDLYGKLHGHEGCVNAVEFNASGNVLVSGSDDTEVIFWGWESKKKLLSYPSGHMDNIFQAKIMPFTDDRKIVTSSGDGQVRLGVISDNGEVFTVMLGKHEGNVYKLAVEPGSPYTLYSGGEDGLVQRFDLRSNSSMKLFVCSAFKNDGVEASRLSLKSIVIDPRNPYYLAVGGSDEFARIYDIRKYEGWGISSLPHMPVNTFCPPHLVGNDGVHVTGLAYSNSSELLVSYNDELVYLFQNEMGLGSTPNRSTPPESQHEDLEDFLGGQVYSGHRNARTVKGVNFLGPNDEYVCSGSDCGHIFIWKKKSGKLIRVMAADRYIVNQIESHPFMPVFASCGIEKTIKLWAPLSEDIPSFPPELEKVLGRNKKGREAAKIALTPDVIMSVLRLQGRQAMAFIERRHNRGGDSDDDDEGDESFILNFSDGLGPSEDDDADQPSECNPS